MKKILNGLITNILSIYYKSQLPSYSGNYFISSKTSYLSQFGRVLPSTIKLNQPLTNRLDIKKYGARDSKEFTFWAWRNCGIICVKMIMEVKGKGKSKSVIDLTKEGIEFGGYITYVKGKFIDKGWFHHSLVSLLKKYKINARTKKWQTAQSVALDILNNKLVVLSVTLPGRSYIKEDGSFEAKKNAKYGGHLLLATGVKMKGKIIEGIYAHDPRGLKNYQKNTWIPLDVFKRIFSNRTIVAD